MSTKAQAYYIEFLGVLFVFVASLAFFVNTLMVSIDNTSINPMVQEARVASDYLISAGLPENWNQSNLKRLGITDGFLRINQTKLVMFENMTYSEIKNNLELMSDCYFYFEHKNGTRILINGEQGIGTEPTDAKRVVKNLRLVIYNSEIVRMVTLVWQKA